jgi:hypothetical protein
MRWLLYRTEARNLRPAQHRAVSRAVHHRAADRRVEEIRVGEDRLVLVGRRFSRCLIPVVRIRGSQGIRVAGTQAVAGLRVEAIRVTVRSLLGQILHDRIRHVLALDVRRRGDVHR